MWLLDVNLPNGLARVLECYGIPCDTAAQRGWRDLTNGALADAAFREGFRVTLPQAREEAYLAEFETRWRRKRIEPIAGAVVEWP